MAKRGRPTEEKTEQPIKYTVEYDYDDGTKAIWTYDRNITIGGPVSVEIKYPKNFKTPSFAEEQEKLPKTKRRYINPHNGKEVGYQRAKALGLVH